MSNRMACSWEYLQSYSCYSVDYVCSGVEILCFPHRRELRDVTVAGRPRTNSILPCTRRARTGRSTLPKTKRPNYRVQYIVFLSFFATLHALLTTCSLVNLIGRGRRVFFLVRSTILKQGALLNVHFWDTLLRLVVYISHLVK